MDVIDELLGRSPRMAALREQVRSLLAREGGTRRLPPILITGETGTGKGLLARIIHRASSRASGQFVELNGAAIPEHLLEAELFGYERGAFTDARQAKPGLLEVADHGILFLDEVGLLPLLLQAKLLTVLEDGRVRRLGSTRSEVVDIAIVSATNEDLGAAVRARRFREDLYHRLAVITLSVPPLRERRDDVPLLAAEALGRTCRKYDVPLKQLSPEALAAMRAYAWPGNVRELNGVIERAVLLCPLPTITADVLALDAAAEVGIVAPTSSGHLSERDLLADSLARTGWNISRTAADLGITRNTVRARIARYGLTPAAHDAQADAAPAGGDAAAELVGTGATPATVQMPRGPSIAVLPFRVEDESETSGYFGDGIVEDIIGALASLHELLVISRSSTLRYRGADVDVRAVGREVGVSYVLSGRVRQPGQRLRVSVELAETTRGAVVWASHFDGITGDLFALQDQIASRVVSTIAPQVREAELRRALRKRPESMEAYDCVLRALALIYRLNQEDFTEARAWLEKAIVLDPGYAAPYAWLAIWHSIRVGQGWSRDPAREQAEVLRLAAAAIERDSFDAMALVLAGHARSILRYEFNEAIALFDRALDASPNSFIAWARSSPTYSYVGNPREAIRRAEQALPLSPLDPQIFLPHTALVLAHYVAGEYDEAARWGRKAREENPRYNANLRLLAASLAAGDHPDEAREVSRALVTAEPGFAVARFVEGYAIRDPERRDRLAEHLRAAGLPG
jgi:transcriptional regulator with AAA-type ATPase domain/TolB-like protein/Tfp pilus assembly protein PilF